MKPTIEERMQRQIGLTTKYNELFDIIVTTVETSMEVTATNPAENQWDATTELVGVNVICNDTQYNTITVYINDIAATMNPQIGVVNVGIDGGIDESLHNVPRAIRRTVTGLIDDIYDAVDSWINDIEQ